MLTIEQIQSGSTFIKSQDDKKSTVNISDEIYNFFDGGFQLDMTINYYHGRDNITGQVQDLLQESLRSLEMDDWEYNYQPNTISPNRKLIKLDIGGTPALVNITTDYKTDIITFIHPISKEEYTVDEKQKTISKKVIKPVDEISRGRI